MKIFVCCCLFDFIIQLKSKLDINDFMDLAGLNGINRPHFLFFLANETYYICCKKTIEFIVKYVPEFYERCMEHCPREYVNPESCNCLDLCLDVWF